MIVIYISNTWSDNLNIGANTMRLFRNFLQRDEGLVTIEWVGIAAVMVLAAIGITTFVMQGADGAGGAIDKGLDSIAAKAGTPAGPGTFDGVSN